MSPLSPLLDSFRREPIGSEELTPPAGEVMLSASRDGGATGSAGRRASAEDPRREGARGNNGGTGGTDGRAVSTGQDGRSGREEEEQQQEERQGEHFGRGGDEVAAAPPPPSASLTASDDDDGGLVMEVDGSNGDVMDVE